MKARITLSVISTMLMLAIWSAKAHPAELTIEIADVREESGRLMIEVLGSEAAFNGEERSVLAIDMPARAGRVTFATAGPQTRTTQLFINFADNSVLDDPERVGSKFAPFGDVIQGMEVVEAIYADYGERPRQGRLAAQGNDYLEDQFPELDYIIAATIVEPDEPKQTAAATQPAE